MEIWLKLMKIGARLGCDVNGATLVLDSDGNATLN